MLKSFESRVTALGVLAGLLYNSWPFGYLLNPKLAHAGFGSELEAVHQPYNWLFITCDVLSGLLVLLVAYSLWRRFQIEPRLRKWLAVVCSSLAVFALGTIMGALIPLHCAGLIERCPSFWHDAGTLWHAIPGIAAALSLFVTLAAAWWLQRRSWLLSGLLLAMLTLGVVGFFSLMVPGSGRWSQHPYIVLCGLWLGLLPRTVFQAIHFEAKTEAS